MEILSAIGILICFVLLIVGSYKKISIYLIAVAGATIIAALSGLNVIDTLTGVYMNGFTSFVKSWILVMSFGALLGSLYDKSGAAWRIGATLIKKTSSSVALYVYIAVGVILTYAGIAVPVTLFALIPFAKVIFQKAKIPWYLFPGITGFAIATFSMTSIPGALQVCNLIPVEELGTTATAAPIEGLAAAIFAIIVGVLYINHVVKRNHDDPMGALEHYEISGADIQEEELEQSAPGFVSSLIPVIATLLCINVFKLNMLIGFFIGCVLAIILFRKSISDMAECVSGAFNNGILPCVLVSAVVGLGSVISQTPIFNVVQESVMNVPVLGLPKVAIVTTAMAGISASASGGIQLALDLFKNDFLSWGFSPEIIHRVASIASSGFDSLPWNGSVVMLFALSGVGYNKGYKHVAVLTVILPIVCSFVAIAVYYIIH